VKSNQPTLLASLEKIAMTKPPADRYQTTDLKRHGRQEHRHVETFDLEGKLDTEWQDLIVCAARIERLTWHKDTKSGLWFSTEETSFYVCQTALDAKAFGEAVRGHWGIEKRNHHVRDVTFGEDASRIRTKPTGFARFRSFALNILRANRVTNIAQELYTNALNFTNLLSYTAT
jgi:predicted transposase YbfD/YdcC